MRKDRIEHHAQLVPEGIAVAGKGEKPALLGGYCPACERYFFPRRQYCPQCLQPPRQCELKGAGLIYSFTVVRTKPPFGLPQPYAVGYVDLAESGLRVFGLFDPGDIGHLAIGSAVNLKVGPLGADSRGGHCQRPFFSLAEKEANHG